MLTYAEVRDHVLGPDERPAQGQTVYVPSGAIHNGDVAQEAIPVVGVWDSQGRCTVRLAARDDVGTAPTGLTYSAVRMIRTESGALAARSSPVTFDVLVADQVAGIDLPSRAAVEPLPQLVRYVLSVAGVLPDGSGNVPLSAADLDLDFDADPAGTAASLVAAHSADTTAIHGIADTSTLETQSGAQTKATSARDQAVATAASDATTKANAAQTAADQAAATALAAHDGDTTSVHGIVDTSALETGSGAAAKVTAHAGATDPHGDRAYADGVTGPLASRVTAVESGAAYKAQNLADLADASTARGNLGLGGAATLNVGAAAGTVTAGDDSRLSNARTPTAHAGSHASGGSDPVTPAAIGALTQALADLRYLLQTGGTLTGTVTNNVATATTPAFGGGVSGDGFDRWRMLANGTIEAGPGNAARDVNFRRSAANEWTTDDALIVSLALRHLGTTLGFYGAAAVAKPTVSGSRGGNAALASLLTALAQLGLITDSTTA